jgi:hypothetical protein
MLRVLIAEVYFLKGQHRPETLQKYQRGVEK